MLSRFRQPGPRAILENEVSERRQAFSSEVVTIDDGLAGSHPELAKARKQAEQAELHEAALLRKFHQMEKIPFTPIEFGFVLSLRQIDTHNLRQDALAKAQVARDLGFDRKKYHAAAGS